MCKSRAPVYERPTASVDTAIIAIDGSHNCSNTFAVLRPILRIELALNVEEIESATCSIGNISRRKDYAYISCTRVRGEASQISLIDVVSIWTWMDPYSVQ